LFRLTPTAMAVVAIIGAATAIFAATIGIAQNDIKKVLAYSTVSQLGYMFLAAGVGAFTAAIFHLMTHAFFKACLFLGAGSVIHGCGGEQDMRKMGGLRKYMPRTHWTMLVATIAIAGIPPLAGFFSKDEILAGAFAYSPAIWIVGSTMVDMVAYASRMPAAGETLVGDRFVRVDDPLTTLPAAAFAREGVHALAGIGHPARFFAQLAALGIAATPHPLADHHRFVAGDLALPEAQAILMTEKDALKCETFADERCWYLPVRARIDEALVKLIEGKLRGSQAA